MPVIDDYIDCFGNWLTAKRAHLIHQSTVQSMVGILVDLHHNLCLLWTTGPDHDPSLLMKIELTMSPLVELDLQVCSLPEL